MTTIHFIRHGEVENPDNLYYGRLPGFPINEDGRKCIEYTARQLKRYPIVHVYHSPLLRTTQTAEIIAQAFGCPMTTDERIIEIATYFEGKVRGFHSRVLEYPEEKSGYAETMTEIYDRMADFVRDVAQKHPDQQIVAVGHGGPIRLLEMGLQNEPFTDWSYSQEEVPACGSDTIITIDGDQFRVERIGL